MRELTQFQRVALVIIESLDEPKGVEINEKMQEYYQQEVNAGRLYPNLNDLVDSGLVDKHEKDRRTNGYALTEDGRQILENDIRWLANAVPDLFSSVNTSEDPQLNENIDVEGAEV